MSRGRGARSRTGEILLSAADKGYFEEPGGLRWMFRDARLCNSKVVGTNLGDPSATHRYFEAHEARDAVPLGLDPDGRLDERLERPRRQYVFRTDERRDLLAESLTRQFRFAEPVPRTEKREVLRLWMASSNG